MANIGREHHEFRGQLLQKRKVGITKLYNQFHDSKISDEEIQVLRELHVKNDVSVVAAYGWSDIMLDHGFHDVANLPVSDRTRFTISEDARIEVLRRLSDLNRQRYQEEVAAGLHESQALSKKPKAVKRQAVLSKVTTSQQQAGFDFVAVSVHLEKLDYDKTKH